MTGPLVLVVGKSGQLARELGRASWPEGWRVEFADRTTIDLSRPDAAAASVTRAGADLVVNAAAYTAVDRAETERDLAVRVNAESPGAIATVCAQRRIPFVTISTDYVFDGTKVNSYAEDDPVAPLGTYGFSKERGERLVRNAQPWHLILRTSWVFSAFGTNFVRTMLNLGASRQSLRIVADQWGRPTAAGDLAAALIAASATLISDRSVSGTYHVANSGAMSWYDFACAIFDEAKLRGARTPELIPITTAEFPTPAKRPLNSELSCEKFEKTFGTLMRSNREALRGVLNELLVQRNAT